MLTIYADEISFDAPVELYLQFFFNIVIYNISANFKFDDMSYTFF